MLMTPKQTRTKLGNFIFGPYEIIGFNTTSVTLKAIGKPLKNGSITVPLERIIKIPKSLSKIKIKCKYPKLNTVENFSLFTGDLSLIVPAFAKEADEEIPPTPSPTSPPSDPRIKFELKEEEMKSALEAIQIGDDDENDSASTLDEDDASKQLMKNLLKKSPQMINWKNKKQKQLLHHQNRKKRQQHLKATQKSTS